MKPSRTILILSVGCTLCNIVCGNTGSTPSSLFNVFAQIGDSTLENVKSEDLLGWSSGLGSVLSMFNRSQWFFNRFYRGVTDVESDPASKCTADLQYVFGNMRSKESMQMLDASARIPSGIFRGNLLWMGNYEECVNVHIPRNSGKTIDGTYCNAIWKVDVSGSDEMLQLKMLPFLTGICLPQSCSGPQVEGKIKNIINNIQKYLVPKTYRGHLNLISLNCESKTPISTAEIVFMVFLGIYLSIIVFATALTVIDYFEWDLPMLSAYVTDMDSNYKLDVYQVEPPKTYLQPLLYKYVETLKAKGSSVYLKVCQSQLVESCLRSSGKYVRCFCFLTNCQAILNTKTSKGELQCIHGIRVFSMAWIILGHTYSMSLFTLSNYLDFIGSLEGLQFYLVEQAVYAVDTFFFLSGFLFGRLALDMCEKLKGNVNILLMWSHRLIRIMPSYGFVLFFVTLLYRHLSSGPLWLSIHPLRTECSKWWWNLLFINNFLPLKEDCVAWAWYLALDVQFFLLSTLLLYILWRWNRLGLAATTTCLVGSWLLTMYICQINNIQFTSSSGIADTHIKNPTNSLKERGKFTNLIYRRPYTRVGPYLIGFIFSYMFRNKLPVERMKPRFLAWGWICSSICAIAVIMGRYHVPHSQVALFFTHIHISLASSIFAACIAWVVYCCLTQNSELVNRLLSLEIWIPLSRLTYCAYLCHLLVLMFYYHSQMNTMHFSHFNWIMLFISFFVVSYAVALVMSAMIETPFLRLEKLLRNKAYHELQQDLKSDKHSVKNI